MKPNQIAKNANNGSRIHLPNIPSKQDLIIITKFATYLLKTTNYKQPSIISGAVKLNVQLLRYIRVGECERNSVRFLFSFNLTFVYYVSNGLMT